MSTTTFVPRTRHFTHRVPLTRQAFRARIAGADDLTTVEQAGYVEVLKNGVHVARHLHCIALRSSAVQVYLTHQRVLWYEPPAPRRSAPRCGAGDEDAHKAWLQEQAVRAETLPEWLHTADDLDLPSLDGPWPPTCPECGAEMHLKFSRRSNQPFWSCTMFEVRRPGPGRAEPVCRGTRPFSLHPEELAEYHAWTPPHHPDWSPEANKAHERSQYRWKWEQLAARSLERVQPQPERIAVLG